MQHAVTESIIVLFTLPSKKKAVSDRKCKQGLLTWQDVNKKVIGLIKSKQKEQTGQGPQF